jgi:hypothetical protein
VILGPRRERLEQQKIDVLRPRPAPRPRLDRDDLWIYRFLEGIDLQPSADEVVGRCRDLLFRGGRRRAPRLPIAARSPQFAFKLISVLVGGDPSSKSRRHVLWARAIGSRPPRRRYDARRLDRGLGTVSWRLGPVRTRHLCVASGLGERSRFTEDLLARSVARTTSARGRAFLGRGATSGNRCAVSPIALYDTFLSTHDRVAPAARSGARVSATCRASSRGLQQTALVQA